jgi:putative nucleotidyltransferase with HDIG domain
MSRYKIYIYYALECVLLLTGLGVTVISSDAAQWRPLTLVVLLGVFTVLGQRMVITVRNHQMSASFMPLVLTMTLLGPPAGVAFGLVAMIITSTHRRLSAALWLNNLATYVIVPLVGGLTTRLLIGDVNDLGNTQITSVTFGVKVFVIFMLSNALAFALIAINSRILNKRSLRRQVRSLFVPMLPGLGAVGALTAILATAYTNLGYPVLLGLVMVIVIFQKLTVALVRSEERADQLEARSVHLASLQLGVLTTLVETLALRDPTTARHAAAVARYARELAREVGCDESDQDLVHTAGLLHDIGKFALPDRILKAEILSDDDWAVIRRHPQEGATLVGRLDGYGPVADSILYHHENVDGSGYPAGLIGNEIPLNSRILRICSAYDTMTARDSYRAPMTPQDAITELRKCSGRHFDTELVNRFIEMLEHDGPVTSAQGDHANFEAELAFERRARAIAQPS